ncbi:MAG: glycoside hydrolase family protein [Magnetococcales bacterium]|nr:glycoside hydrolase family protein [Magnetococcales bacterium]
MAKTVFNIDPTIDDTTALIERLIKHEKLMHGIYKCPAGKWTIGVGRNIQDVGISNEELIWLFQNRGFEGVDTLMPSSLSRPGALYLLANDINRVITELQKNVPGFDQLVEARKHALIDMCFNLGLSKFMGFKKMLAALKERDWDHAAVQMLDSKWAKQVGSRSTTLAAMMQNGSY